MRLDSHQHFWRYHAADYPWMSDALVALRRDFLPDDLLPLLTQAGFDGTVAVQARQTLDETAWLLNLAEQNPFIRGVVGWVDLCGDGLRPQLQRFHPHTRFVGVRHVVHDEPDDRFMLRPEFRRGIGQLLEFGLTYDLLLYPRHLRIAAQLVEEFPHQPFVLDHLAKPDIRHGILSPWREDLRRLSAFPNVHCKLSGLVTEAHWHHWQAEDFRPYLDAVLEAFGPSRLMIGSDWPVCTVSGNYPSTLDVVLQAIRSLPAPEQAGILGDNCARFYGIDPAPRPTDTSANPA